MGTIVWIAIAGFISSFLVGMYAGVCYGDATYEARERRRVDRRCNELWRLTVQKARAAHEKRSGD
jgi:hypothetical protein